MKEEELIKKWLKDELIEEEFVKFKQLDSYSSYAKISDFAHRFKAPKFDEKASKDVLDSHISKKDTMRSRFKWVASIAAIIVVIFGLSKVLNLEKGLQTFETEIANIQTLHLPDHSKVQLSSKTFLAYNPKNWESIRSLELRGEAYFEVAKGKTFTVETKHGLIQVLGTEFNVKSRNYGLEVTCYEGAVLVKIDNEDHILKKNQKLIFTDKNVERLTPESDTPDWKTKSTVLKSKPLSVVLEEFTNYYDVSFETSQVDTSRLYTGSFNHNDIETALKSITLPLNLTYQIKERKVILDNK